MTKRDWIRLAAVTLGPHGPLLLICGSDGFYLEVGLANYPNVRNQILALVDRARLGRWTEIGAWRHR